VIEVDPFELDLTEEEGEKLEENRSFEPFEFPDLEPLPAPSLSSLDEPRVNREYHFGSAELGLLRELRREILLLATRLSWEGLHFQARALRKVVNESWYWAEGTLQKLDMPPYGLVTRFRMKGQEDLIPEDKIVLVLSHAPVESNKTTLAWYLFSENQIIVRMPQVTTEDGIVIVWALVGIIAHELFHGYQDVWLNYTHWGLDRPGPTIERVPYTITAFFAYQFLREKGVTDSWGKYPISPESEEFKTLLFEASQFLWKECFEKSDQLWGSARSYAFLALVFHNRKLRGWSESEAMDKWNTHFREHFLAKWGR
jgi:hypothetical protein